ncbi:Separin [Sparganum proliferum]
MHYYLKSLVGPGLSEWQLVLLFPRSSPYTEPLLRPLYILLSLSDCLRWGESMEALDQLLLFFKEFDLVTSQLRKLVPTLKDKLLDVLNQTGGSENPDEEVFAGLPTIFNAQSMFAHLDACVPRLSPDVKLDETPSRSLFTKLELVGVLSSIYSLQSAGKAAWLTAEHLAHSSKRTVDEAHALLNRLFIELLDLENNRPAKKEDVATKVTQIQQSLADKSELLSDYEKLRDVVKLPTPHANLQCIVVDALHVYISHYLDWHAINARLDLVLTRHKDFLDSKCWAAVYCRGFVYWLRLRARCSSGVPATGEDSESSVCPLFAAINVRLHGRTLVRFMLSHCEQKAGRGQNNDQGEKENRPPDSLPTKDADSKAAFWLGNQVSDADLVNLWLGTRLLLEGSIQVAELYTLLGTVKEARAYQLELLRVAQRFHIPSCAQTALSLMAYTDLLAQRKWAFDLRLSQLNHISCSKTSLSEILRTRRPPDPAKTGSRPPRSKQAPEESSFLRTRRFQTTALIGSARPPPSSADEDGDPDSLSMAMNPLLNAAAGGLSNLFPTSPVKSTMQLSSAADSLSTGFPSPTALTAAIESNSHYAGVVARGDGHIPQSRPGLLSAETCVARILYGSLWRWLEDVTTLVREEVLASNHFLPVLLPPVTATATPPSPANESSPGQSPSPPRVSESPPKVDGLAVAIAECRLTSPSAATATATAVPRAPSTKAGRAGRSRLAGPCFRTPVIKPIDADCAEKLNGRTLNRVPNAPQRLADIALSEELVGPTSTSSRRTRSSRQREQSAPVDTKSTRPPGDVFATPLPVRSRQARKSPPAPAAQETSSLTGSHFRTPRASSVSSLFGPLKQTDGFTFGSLDTRTASVKPARSLQILRDTAPSTIVGPCYGSRRESRDGKSDREPKADPPRLCLFKDPEPVEPRTNSLRHAIAAARSLKSTTHRRRQQQHPANHEPTGQPPGSEDEEEVEHCPSRFAQPPRPMNLRLGSRWAASRAKAESPLSATARIRDPDAAAAAASGLLAELTHKQDVLADRLYQAYSQLSSLPVPSLLRPICQLLGLRWLGKGDQRQAARFLSQSVGLAASSLYASILCSKIK